jgi:hypothetical protein
MRPPEDGSEEAQKPRPDRDSDKHYPRMVYLDRMPGPETRAGDKQLPQL